MIIRRGGCGQDIFELVISKYRKPPWTSTQLRNRMLMLVAATISPRPALLSGHSAQGCWVRQVDAGDLDDGLPCGFLAGTVVEVWVTLHLNWA